MSFGHCQKLMAYKNTAMSAAMLALDRAVLLQQIIVQKDLAV